MMDKKWERPRGPPADKICLLFDRFSAKMEIE